MQACWITCILLIFFYGTAAQINECDEDNGWHELNGYCFRLSRSAPETQYTWQQSRQACMEEGGDLASIHSEEEQSFITNISIVMELQGLRLWIGMSQMDDKTGPFVWSDGSDTIYTDWSSSEPRRYGLTNCGFTLTEKPPTGFLQRDSTSVTEGILDPELNFPEEADGIDTFFFGRGEDLNMELCEQACKVEDKCAAYSWHWYNPRTAWDHVCVGRSDRYNILADASYSDSGIRAMGASPDGWWLTGNCGLKHAFVCKKQIGSDEPITVEPTKPIQSYCPAGYFTADGHTGNKCYKIYQMGPESVGLPWHEALLDCRQGPGVNPDLASIHSVKDNAFITSQIVDNGIGYWIGGHYSTSHSTWVWTDNTEPVYANWAPYMPSGLEQCMEFWGSNVPSGTWSNLACQSLRGYICQTYKDGSNIVPTPPVSTPSDCPADWTTYRGECYRLETQLRTWEEASTNCVSLGGKLTSVHSEAENSAVFIIADENFPVWIGLHQLESEDPTYVWSDNSPNLYANFEDRGPGGAGCVHMKSNSKWREVVCNSTYMSVCKISNGVVPTVPPPQQRGCPSVDWIAWGGHCYLFSREIVQYNEALLMCKALSSESFQTDLVSIGSYEENEFILTQQTIYTAYYSAWLGLEFNTVTLTYEWRDGSTSSYRNWAPDHPESPIEQQCAEMHLYTEEHIGMWKDQHCDDYNYFVCKTNIGPALTYPPVPTPTSGECPSVQWIKHETDCFLIRPSQQLNWQAALDTCKLLTGGEGSLASIKNQEENQFIFLWAEYLKPEYETPDLWIGLYKQGYGYPFIWTDGSPLDYNNWAYQQPNDIDGTQNCVRMHLTESVDTARWGDYYCAADQNHGYVCRTKQGSYDHLNHQIIDKMVKEIEANSTKVRQQISGHQNLLNNGNMGIPHHLLYEENHIDTKDKSHFNKNRFKPKKELPSWVEHKFHNVLGVEPNQLQGNIENTVKTNVQGDSQTVGIILGAIAGTILLSFLITIVYMKTKRKIIKTQDCQETRVYNIQLQTA